MARMAEARTTANAMGELARGDTLAVGTRRGIGAARSEQSAARSERLKPGCHDLDACGRRHAWTINFFVRPKRGVPQLSPLAQLQLPLPIGDEGIPQCGSESLSSAHLSAQLQLSHQLSSSFHFLLATTESPNMDENASAQSVSSASASTSYWRRRNPPVWIKIPQLSSPLSSAPAHPSALLLEQQLYMSNIHVFLSQGGDIARSK